MRVCGGRGNEGRSEAVDAGAAWPRCIRCAQALPRHPPHLSASSAVAHSTSSTATRRPTMSPRAAAPAATATAGSASAACGHAPPPLPPTLPPPAAAASGLQLGSASWEASGDRQHTARQCAAASTSQLLRRSLSGTGRQPPWPSAAPGSPAVSAPAAAEPQPGSAGCPVWRGGAGGRRSQAPPLSPQSARKRCRGLTSSLSYSVRSRHTQPCGGAKQGSR